MQNVTEFIIVGEPNECWTWTGYRNKLRNDRPTFDGRNASRYIWVEANGEPPDGYHVEHLCENSHCVNLTHLDAVPPEVNYAKLKRTHCKRGHELTPENRIKAGEYAPGKPRWKCKVCTVAREMVRTERRKRIRQGGQ